MRDILSDEQITHPLNEDLLRKAEEIRNEHETLRARLAKLEESRGSVTESVYQRVHADYEVRLREAMGRLNGLKRELEEEEKALVEKKNLTEVHIAAHKEKLEESKLRFTLGEFDTQEHQKIIEKESNQISRLESALKKLDEGIRRHQEIFSGELPQPEESEEEVEEIVDEEALPSAPQVQIEEPSSLTIREPSAPPASPPMDDTARIQSDLAKPSPAPAPSPSATSRRKIAELQVMEKGKVIQTVPLDKTIVIGRSPSNDVVLREAKVSRKHAEIQYAAGKYVLVDLESSNGTYVGGKKIKEYVLKPNDEITIGITKMIFKV